MSYNVENLFDIQDDSLKNDNDFLPDGNYHWTFYRYKNKLSRIAQVISAIGEWQAPTLVSLIEVESDSCLIELRKWHLRKRFYPYQHLITEGSDARGINIGLLYDTTILHLIDNKSIRIAFHNSEHTTRDILYAAFAVNFKFSNNVDTLHCFACHFPSQRGGAALSEERRQTVRKVLQHQVDSLLLACPNAKIIAMGDFNCSPEDNLQPLVNIMTTMNNKNIGTYKYHGRWTCLDQFYVSPSLQRELSSPQIFAPEWLLEEDETYLGKKPKRTYLGPRYNDGYSDHLPIFIDWTPASDSIQ